MGCSSLTLSLAALALAPLQSGCESDTVKDAILGEGSDVSRAGVIQATRRPNGTIELFLLGVKGAQTYTVEEFERDENSGTLNRTRSLKTLTHSPGRLDYTIETYDIPFGKNFCYQASVSLREGGDQDLGAMACLEDNSAWYFTGAKRLSVDAAGQVVLSWNKIPTDGAAYEIKRSLGTGSAENLQVIGTARDISDYTDEVGENVFPRCYSVRVSHPLFSRADNNENLVCLDAGEHKKQMLESPDAQRPRFEGIRNITAERTNEQSMWNKLLDAAGLSSPLTVKLTWLPAADNLTRDERIAYHIYRVKSGSRGELNYDKPYAITAPGELSFTDDDFDELAPFEYLVRAVDERGNMDVNEEWRDIPLDFEAPIFKGALSAVSERRDQQVQVRVSWARAFDNKTDPAALEYRIFRRLKGDADFDFSTPVSIVTGSASDTISALDATVSRGFTYEYLVRVADSSGNVDGNSKVVEVEAIGRAPEFDGIKSVMRVGETLSSKIKEYNRISWTSASDDDTPITDLRYIVYRSSSEIFDQTNLLAVTDPGLTSYIDKTSSPDNDYYYAVRAMDKNGFEDENAVVRLLAKNKPPQWPANSNQNAPGPEWTGLIENKISWDKTLQGAPLQWSAPSDDSTEAKNLVYRIYRNDRPNNFNFSDPLTTLESGSASSDVGFIDKSGHSSGRAFYYSVIAIDEFGAESAPSSVVQLPANAPPLPPVNPRAKQVAPGSQEVRVEWNSALDDRTLRENMKYTVRRLEEGAEPVTIATAWQETYYIDPIGANPSKNYSWTVSSIDSYGLSSDATPEFSLSENTPPQEGGILSALRSSSTSVTVKWIPSLDLEQTVLTYKVYAMEVPPETPVNSDGTASDQSLIQSLFFEANVRQEIRGTVDVVTFGTFDAGKTYLFGVRAFDDPGLTDGNLRAIIIPRNLAPTYAGLSQAELSPDGSGRLSWIAASDDQFPTSELDYKVYKLESLLPNETAADIIRDGEVSLYATAGAGTTSYTDFDVNPSVFSHYIVRAIDPWGMEDENTVVKTLPRDQTRPVFLGIQSSSMNQRRITLVWAPAEDARTPSAQIVYKIYTNTSPELADLLATDPIGEVSEGAISFSHTPDSILTHYYLVRAFDAAGNHDINESVHRTVDEIPPEFDGLLAGFPITDKSVQVFWTGIENEDVHQVKIYSIDDLVTPIASVFARDSEGRWVNSYTITGLTPATSYSFIARATDGAGNEEQNTKTVSLTTLANTPPLFAGLESARAAPGVDGLTNIDLEWAPASGATHFRIFRVNGASEFGTEFDFNFDTCKSSWASPVAPGCIQIEADALTSFRASGLSKNQTYSFIVRAYSLAGDSNEFVIGEERNRLIRVASTLTEVKPTFAGASEAKPAAGDAGLNSIVVKWGDPANDGVWDGFYLLYKDFSSYPDTQTSFPIPDNFSSDPSLQVFTVADPFASTAAVGSLTLNKRYCFTVVTRYLPVETIRSTPDPVSGFQCAKPEAQPPSFYGVKGSVDKGAGAQAFKQMTVHWDPAQGSFTRYEVSWSEIDDFISETSPGSFFIDPSRKADVLTRGQSSYIIQNLEPNTTYYARVRAVFELSGQGVFLHAGSSAVAQNRTSPVAPNGDGILSVKQISDDEVELRWDAPNNGGLYDRYYIFQETGSGADTAVLAHLLPDLGNSPPYTTLPYLTVSSTSSNFESRSYTLSGVFPDTRYCFVVRAAYAGSEGFIDSPNAKVGCVDVEISPPDFSGITALKAPNSAQGFTSLTASWEPATGNFTRYEYALTTGQDDAPTWTEINGGIDTNFVTITGLTANTLYYVRVRALYSKNSVSYTSGEASQRSARTTPKAPAHAGLDPVKFLAVPGEVELSWDLPNPDPDIGGLYNRFLLWRYTGGSSNDIMDEIDALTNPERDGLSPGVITASEASNLLYHFKEIVSTSTNQTSLTGADKLPENVETCFLVRAAYRSLDEKLFLMSGNQVVRCVTPTASAPLFGGIKTLENIPNSVNGFSQLKATWNPAQGNFSRYEIALSLVSGADSWTPRAAVVNAMSESSRLLFNQDESGTAATALQAHTTYYGRVRAVYQGSDSTLYTAGGSSEIGRVVLPNRPLGDGIRDATSEKVPGEAANATLTLKGDATGFWDKVFVWRESDLDKGTASNQVQIRAQASADGKSFASPPDLVVSRPSSSSTQDLSLIDTGVQVGEENCYIARAGHNTSPNFLLSDTQQLPVCVRPDFEPISFAGVSDSGSEICAIQEAGSNAACDPSERWPNTGNSKIRLRLQAAPAGDFDFYDVYMGTVPDANLLLSQSPFQTILKGDLEHDPDPSDVYLHVGGRPDLYVPPGNLYFLVRVRCVSCAFVDNNSNVSNPIAALRPYVLMSHSFIRDPGARPINTSAAAYGAFEDEMNLGILSPSGVADLIGGYDYLKSTNPGQFAPKPGRTFGIRFDYSPGVEGQNKEGSAIFALDSGNRQPWWNGAQLVEGSHLGTPGASVVYDERNERCLFMGGYAGDGFNTTDWPFRDWRYDWRNNNSYHALRFQAWDGQNLSEIRTRGPSPLPRSMPVTAYNPETGNVVLFGGFDQGSTQKLRADTWEWDGRSWSLVSEGPLNDQFQPGQIGRYGDGVMAFDPFRKQMVMVGGRWRAPCGSNSNDWNRSRITRTGRSDCDWFRVIRDVRNSHMTHFFPDAEGQMNWQDTVALPAGFPTGYPAALVSIPLEAGEDIAGLYYLATEWIHWERSDRTHNVWKWNGTVWQELPNTQVPFNRPYAALYAAYDPVKQKIVMTFGRGNEDTGQKVFDWDPRLRTWTVHQASSAPLTSLGQAACFDPKRREFVVTGGVPNYSINDEKTKRSLQYYDVHVFSTATNSWRRPTVAFDHSSMGMFQKNESLKGIQAIGGPQWGPGFWLDWSQAFANYLFKNGFWSELPIDPALKYRWWDQHQVNYYSDTRLSEDLVQTMDSEGNLVSTGSGRVYRIWKSTHHALASTAPGSPEAVTGYGQPERVMTFDGTGWQSKPILSSDLKFHQRFCPEPSVTGYASHPYSHPNFRLDWESVSTPWGILAATYDVYAYWPYNFFPTEDPICTDGLGWRYSRSPFLLLEESEDGFHAKQLVETGRDTKSWGETEPYQFCQPPSNIVHNDYLTRTPYMQWSPKDEKVWLFGSRDGDWSLYYRNIQALSFNPTDKCWQVENFEAPFDATGWSYIRSYNWRMDYWAFDEARNVILVLTKHGISSTVADGSTLGVMWELNLNTKTWKQRILPDAFRKWSALQGNRIRVAALPGKPGEFYVQGTNERHTDRYLHESYTLKVTENSIRLVPNLPRFGLTVGDDERSGYLSVPGDPGDPDILFGQEQLYQGRRKIAENLNGTNTLWVTFGASTYDVTLNGTLVANDIPWDGTSASLYVMDFLLGARYASFYRHDDNAQSAWRGIGNTNISVDWVKMFEKELSPTEMDFWEGVDDNTLP